MARSSCVLICAILVSLISQSASPLIAKSIERWDATDSRPASFELVTVGAGTALYSGAGHSLLRVHHPQYRYDTLFNWGVFDSEVEGFASKFYQGTLDYRLLVQDSQRYFTYMKDQNHRGVIRQAIRLTDEQKTRLVQSLQSQLKNSSYQYHVFRQNCATMIRDALDQALDQEISRKTRNRFVSASVRDRWRDYFSPWTSAYLAADLLFNDDVDRPLSLWEDMFTPLRLQQILSDFRVSDGKTLLAQEEMLVPPGATSRQPSKIPPYTWFLVLIFLMTLPSFALRHKRPRLARATFCASLGLWGFLSTLLSLAMILTPALSIRHYWFFSLNLTIFWPIDFLYVWGATPGFRRHKAGLLWWLAALHIACLVVTLGLTMAGAMQQDMQDTMLFIGAPLMLVWVSHLWSFRKFGLSLGRPSRKIIRSANSEASPSPESTLPPEPGARAS